MKEKSSFYLIAYKAIKEHLCSKGLKALKEAEFKAQLALDEANGRPLGLLKSMKVITKASVRAVEEFR